MGLISTLSSWLRPAPPLPEEVVTALERTVDQVDPLLRTESGYRKRLGAATAYALEYCDVLVSKIPGPIEVTHRAYGDDALIHALFPAAGEIAATLAKSRDLREFVADPKHRAAGVFYALLGMRRHEKHVLGMALNGELIQAEAPQTLLYFGDHTLRSPALEEHVARRGLRDEFFDSLVSGFADQVAARRQEHLALQGKASLLRAQARGASAGEHIDSHALDAALAAAAADLAPSHLLNELIFWLADPQPHLRMEPFSVTVDLLGVETASDATGAGIHTLHFPEMFSRDRRHWLVLLVRIPRNEALAALACDEQAHRYIVI